MKDFGERLRALRESKGWSQQQLGEKIHRTKNIVYRMESGIQSPTLDILVDLSQEFGVSIDYLCGLRNADTLTPKHQRLLSLLQSTFDEMPSLSLEEKYRRLKEIQTSISNLYY